MNEGFESFEAWRAHEVPGGEAERRALKQRAIALLARREHSRAELRRKLLATPVGGGRMAAAGMGGDAHGFHDPEAGDLLAEPELALDDSLTFPPFEDGSMSRPEERGRRGRRAARRAGAPRVLPSPALVDAVLDELTELKLLSDRRMAEALVRGGAARFGAARIAQNLQRKGVEAGLIADVLEPLAGSETDRAREVWQRRFGRAPANLKERAKQYRFLLARGFAGGVVARVVPRVSGRAAEDEGWDDVEG